MLAFILCFILGLEPLHQAGFRGQGITIAVIDAGFYRANESEIFPQEQIIETHDLLHEGEDANNMFAHSNDAHGTMCLSTMLCQSDSFVGTAPDAQFILIRTEDIAAEYIGEVDRLCHGMLLADSLGADIVSISLGYNLFDDSQFDCRYEDLNGQSKVSQTATLLARHGRLVCVAAGNEGNKEWRHITWPADADSIITVGACDSLGNVANFSSIGPTADERIKPDVIAWGQHTWVFSPTGNKMIRSNGTSFACPEVAGMAASLWSALPELNAMQLRERILSTSSQHLTPNNSAGYGIPDAAAAWHYQPSGDSMNHTSAAANKTWKNGELRIITPTGIYNILGIRLR